VSVCAHSLRHRAEKKNEKTRSFVFLSANQSDDFINAGHTEIEERRRGLTIDVKTRVNGELLSQRQVLLIRIRASGPYRLKLHLATFPKERKATKNKSQKL
jgi:hypothetical protein